MGDIEELERRISAAFDRIGRAVDLIAPAQPAAGDSGQHDALQAERAENARLAERLRAVSDQGAIATAQAQDRIEHLTLALDRQGIELQRLRQTVIQLREALRDLRESQAGGPAGPDPVHAALLAETQALRATRLTEIAQMDEILAELHPLIKEPQNA